MPGSVFAFDCFDWTAIVHEEFEEFEEFFMIIPGEVGKGFDEDVLA